MLSSVASQVPFSLVFLPLFFKGVFVGGGGLGVVGAWGGGGGRGEDPWRATVKLSLNKDDHKVVDGSR